MKNFIIPFFIFIVTCSCKAQEKELYKPNTEHQYEISLINDTLIYNNLNAFINSCDNNQSQNGILNVLYIVNNNGEILDVRINKNIKIYVNDEIGLINFLQSKSKVLLSENAKNFYQILKQDSIYFSYNFTGKRLIWQK